jgi:hypothetical protein
MFINVIKNYIDQLDGMLTIGVVIDLRGEVGLLCQKLDTFFDQSLGVVVLPFTINGPLCDKLNFLKLPDDLPKVPFFPHSKTRGRLDRCRG